MWRRLNEEGNVVEEIQRRVETPNLNQYKMSLKPPKQMVINSDADMSQEWQEWFEMYENYFIAAKVNKEEEAVQTANFISSLGRDALKIINNLNLTTVEKTDLKTLKEKLTAHFSPAKNRTYERYQFHRIKQQQCEAFEEFVQKLKTQVKKCAFPGDSEEFIVDQLVLGVHSETTRQKLWTEDELTLAKAIKMCRAAERAEKQINELQGTSTGINELKRDKIFDCKRCGRKHGYKSCPAFDKQCESCGLRGHFKAMFRARNKDKEYDDKKSDRKFRKKGKNAKKVRSLTKESSDSNEEYSDSDEYVIGSISLGVNTLKEDEWVAKLKVKGKFIRVKLDTGAQCNVLPLKEVKRMNVEIKRSATRRLIAYDKGKVDVIGEIVVDCKNKEHTEGVTFKVVGDQYEAILGKIMCEKLGFVKRINEMNIQTERPGIGCYRDYEYDIDFIDNPSFKIIPPRRIPYAIRNNVKKELQKMEEMGVIERVSEPSPAVSPMTAVMRNAKLRICMDPTELNKNIRRRHFPMKTVEEISAKVAGAKWFTKLDCEKGFWQIKVSKRTSNYLAMSTPWGRYKYLRLPFGISPAPEVFSDIMSRTLEGIGGCEPAMDDVRKERIGIGNNHEKSAQTFGRGGLNTQQR